MIDPFIQELIDWKESHPRTKGQIHDKELHERVLADPRFLEIMKSNEKAAALILGEHPVCAKCGAEVKFVGKKKDQTPYGGYQRYCSNLCALTDTKMHERRTKTMIERYGVENAFQSEVHKEKIKNTMMEKYGVENSAQINGMGKKVSYTKRTNKYTKYPELITILEDKDADRFIALVESSIPDIEKRIRPIIAKEFQITEGGLGGVMDKMGLHDRYKKPAGYSYLEAELQYFLNSIGVTYKIQNNELFKKNATKFSRVYHSIDAQIDDYKLGIEMDGIYWHSENPNRGDKKKGYHTFKTNVLESEGYRLLHAFSNEWDNTIKNKVWLSIIRGFIGLNEVASGNVIKKIDDKTASRFYKINSLYDESNQEMNHYGLMKGKNLIALMSITNRMELRYATLNNVQVDGFGLLLNEVTSIHGKEVTFFVNRRIYRIEDFGQFFHECDEIEEAAYVFNSKGSLLLEDETRIGDMKGYNRIWDCGYWRYYMAK